jgi:hypothetical protein
MSSTHTIVFLPKGRGPRNGGFVARAMTSGITLGHMPDVNHPSQNRPHQRLLALPVLRAGAGGSSPSTLFYSPTIPLQQYRLKATTNRGHDTRFVFVCVLSLRRNTR